MSCSNNLSKYPTNTANTYQPQQKQVSLICVAAQEPWNPRAQSIVCKIIWQSLSSLVSSLKLALLLQSPSSCEILLWSNKIWRNEITKAWPTSSPSDIWSTRTSWSLKRIFAAVFIYQLMWRTKILSSSVKSPYCLQSFRITLIVWSYKSVLIKKEQHNLGIQRGSHTGSSVLNIQVTTAREGKAAFLYTLQPNKTEYSCSNKMLFLKKWGSKGHTSYVLEKSNFVGALWRWEQHLSSELNTRFPLQLAFLSVWLLSLLPENSSEI